MKSLLLSIVILLGFWLPQTAAQGAEALPEPKGPVILTLSGDISLTNAAGEARFDRAMLLALPQQEIATSTDWTDGVPAFRGPLLRDVLAAAGAQGQSLRAIALNDYSAIIPRTDAERYDIVLAMEMDGKRLRVRDKGPLWIVYPRDRHPELRDEATTARWVWQLKAIEVE